MSVVSRPTIATCPTRFPVEAMTRTSRAPLARRRGVSVPLIAPGQSLLAAPDRLVLSAPLAGLAAGYTTVPYPSALTGSSGWWDAGAITSMLDRTGAAITAFGASVGVGRSGQQVGSRRRLTAAVPWRAADRPDHGPDTSPKQCRIPVAASLCRGRVDL
jgi:hypothetical protein